MSCDKRSGTDLYIDPERDMAFDTDLHDDKG